MAPCTKNLNLIYDDSNKKSLPHEGGQTKKVQDRTFWG